MRDRGHHRVVVGKAAEPDPVRMRLAQESRGGFRGHGPNGGAEQRAVKTLIDFRDAGGGGEFALVLGRVVAKRPDVIERPRHDPGHVIALDQLAVRGVVVDILQHQFVETRQHRVEQVHVQRELFVLLGRDRARNENAQMADALVQRIDDGLAVLDDLVGVVVKIQHPVQRLLRRRDVIAPRAKDDDRRADLAQIKALAIAHDDFAGAQTVADEELIDDELHFLGVEQDRRAPPFLEIQKARPLGVDLGIDVIGLFPQRIRGVVRFEVRDQPRAVELAVADIAGQRGQPAAAQQPAQIAHRVLAVHARPIGQWRPGQNDGAGQVGIHRRHHHHLPAGLAIADQGRLALGFGVKLGDDAQEPGFGAADILDGLARHRLGQEADEIAGMAGIHRDADLTVMFHAADARPMPGARIKDDEGAFFRVDHHVCGRDDPGQNVIDRALEIAAVTDQLGVEGQHVRRDAANAIFVIVAALAKHVHEQHRTLHRVLHVFDPRVADRLRFSLRH